MHYENTTPTALKGFLPRPYRRRRYYNVAELSEHNTANDLWVCFFQDIYDVTLLIQQNRSSAFVEPIIAAAGTDITHWFDSKTKQPRKCVNAEGVEEYYLPQGEFLHLRLKEEEMVIPWWKNQEFYIGKLTRKSQWIRIINTLSDNQDKLEVPREETINQIMNRYELINAHARSYTWKRKGKPLNMEFTLEENGVIDQTDLYLQNQVPVGLQYVPALHLHFNDDLTSK